MLTLTIRELGPNGTTHTVENVVSITRDDTQLVLYDDDGTCHTFVDGTILSGDGG